MKRGSPQTFEAFCREAVDFLKSSATPYLMIGGIAVGAIGEPRLTGDVDRRYLHEAVKAVCELAEDLLPLRRLDEVLRKASSAPG